MGKIDLKINPRDFRRISAATMKKYIQQNFDEFVRVHAVYYREIAKLNLAMYNCARALDGNEVETAKMYFDNAQAALTKSKSLDKLIKKAFLIHKYAAQIYKDIPDRQIGSDL